MRWNLRHSTWESLPHTIILSILPHLWASMNEFTPWHFKRYTTIELFNSSLTATTKLKGILEILCSATEYGSIPMRHREDTVLYKLATHLPVKIDKAKYTDPHTKANVLLQAHFSRRPLSADLHQDQQFVTENATRMIQVRFPLPRADILMVFTLPYPRLWWMWLAAAVGWILPLLLWNSAKWSLKQCGITIQYWSKFPISLMSV